jgi:hypothetical protein
MTLRGDPFGNNDTIPTPERRLHGSSAEAFSALHGEHCARHHPFGRHFGSLGRSTALAGSFNMTQRIEKLMVGSGCGLQEVGGVQKSPC